MINLDYIDISEELNYVLQAEYGLKNAKEIEDRILICLKNKELLKN